MNTFNWLKTSIYGVIIWALMLVLNVIYVGLNISAGGGTQFLNIVIIGLLAYLFARTMRPLTLGQAFGSGVIWALIGLVLDAVITTQVVNNPLMGSMVNSWGYWTAYVALLLVPLIYAEGYMQTHKRAM